MSLRVWLPLDGDLTQQGASGINPAFMGTGITWSAGKIGQAATFPNNCNSCIHMPGLRLQTGSIAAWVIIKGSGGGARQCIISEGRDSYNDGVEFWTSQAGTTIYFKAHEKVISTTIALNQWYHIAGTFGDGEVKFYLNGQLKGTPQTYTTDMTYQYASDLTLGKMSYSYTSASNYFPLNGQLNDVRVYDHCLSAAEVHEIAQGLVLHYKLDGGAIGNPNLLPNSKLNGTWAYPSSSYSDKYGPITNIIPSGTQYTLSFDAKSTVNGDKIRTHYYSPNTTTTCISSQGVTKTASDGNMDFTLSTNWERYWVVYTQTSTTAVKHVICPRLLSGQGSGTISVKNVKLEEGSAATAWRPAEETQILIDDSSGYNHNGTSFGSLISTAETGRYSSSTKLNSSSPTDNSDTGMCYIQTPFTLTTPLQMSITWWAKPESGYGGSTNHAAFCTSNNTSRPTDYNTTAFHHRDAGFDIYPSDASGVKRLSFTYTANAWHHYAITYDGSTAKAYQDGVLKTSVAVGSNKTLATFSQLYIGFSQAGGVRRKTLGSYSDFRVYVTALSADDILQLYHTGAKVDNKQNFHTFELVENNSKIQINKRGQTLCDELEEDTATKFYKINQIIETNEIIEL